MRAHGVTSASTARTTAGFTLVEVLVALMVVAIGLSALMVAVSGTARTSGVLRDKTIAEWIALNRLTEVRLNLTKFGQNTDTGEVDFANRKWHYDTRYFDTSVASMTRVVVRVYAGSSNTKGNPLIETVGFHGTQISPPGTSSAVLWTSDSAQTASGDNGGTIGSGTNTINSNAPIHIGGPSVPGVPTTPANPAVPTDPTLPANPTGSTP